MNRNFLSCIKTITCNTEHMKKIFFFSIIVILLIGCRTIKTTDPDECYYYYWGVKPDGEHAKALAGKYWRSPHFTLEYEIYLKMEVSEAWKEGFKKENKMEVDSLGWDSEGFDTPGWFLPDSNFVKYKSISGAHYWEEETGNIVYVYDISL